MKFIQIKFFIAIIAGAIYGLAPHARAEEAPPQSKKVAELSTSLSALTQTATSATNIEKSEDSKKAGFGIATGLEYSQKNAVEERASRESDTSLTLIPSYKFNDTYNISVKAIIDQENSGAKNTKTSDTKITLGMEGFELTNTIKTTHGLSGVVPTSQTSQQRDRLKGAVGLINGIGFTGRYLTLDYQLTLSRNFHEFNINAEGTPNVEFRIAHSFEIKVPITEKFYLTSQAVYRLGRTYGGIEKTSFEIHGDINYDFTKTFGMNIGTSNDGEALKSNGVDSNISAYNDKTSVTRAGLSYVY